MASLILCFCGLSMHTLPLHPKFKSHRGLVHFAFVPVVPQQGVELLRLAALQEVKRMLRETPDGTETPQHCE